MVSKILPFGEEGRRKAFSLLLDVLYPPRCPLCGEAMPVGQKIHPECIGKIQRITGHRCAKCGKPTDPGERLCSDCAETPHRFNAGFGAFVYDGVIRDAILAMKFRGKKEYADMLGLLTAREAETFLRMNHTQYLVPVPMHRKKKRMRGFNQAEVLAVRIGQYTGIPVLKDVLVRTRGTAAMKALDTGERRKNLSGAFRVNGRSPIAGKSLCLIDDIYTTGATADACAEACFAAGAARVVIVTIGTGDDR